MIKRPMLALLAAVTLGIILKDLPVTVAIGVLCAYALIAFLFFLFSDNLKNKILKIVKPAKYGNLIIFIGLLPLLFVLSFWRGRSYDRNVARVREPYAIMHVNNETECIVSGRVRSKDFDGKYYVLKLDRCSIKGFFENEERTAGGCMVYLGEGPVPKCGDHVKVYGKYYFLEEPLNPGQYNSFPKSLKEKVYGRIFAKKLWIGERGNNILGEAVAEAAIRFEEGIRNVFDEDDSGILISMITGNKGFESDEITELYRRAGIGHILAISGLHVSLLILGLWKMLRKLTVNRFLSALISFLFLAYFLFFTGFAVSTLRAGVMCCVFLLGRLLRRHYDMASALGAAGILLLLAYPYELYDPAFILSVSAVAGVCFAREIGAGPFFGVVVTIFTTPVSAYFFYEIPTYSFIANLIVIPLTGMVLMFGIVSGIMGYLYLPLGRFFGGVVFFLLRIFEAVSEFVLGLPFSCILVGKPKPYEMITIYVFMVSACLCIKGFKTKNKEKRLKTVTVLGLSLFLLFLERSVPAGKSLTFLSVGQGDCCVYISDKKNIGLSGTNEKDCVLFDCGSTSEKNVGENVLSPFLKSEAVMLMNKVTVSHTDNDHISGIIEVLENMDVYRNDFEYAMRYKGNIGIRTLVMPKVKERGEAYNKLLELARKKNVKVEFIQAGDELPMRDRGCRLRCLAPYEADTSENETSLVFFLETPEFKALLMGDAGIEAEGELLEKGSLNEVLREPQKTLILKVGHHGSRSASSDEFLELIEPDIAIVSCGRGNAYGHPHWSVIRSLEEVGAEVHRIDKEGAVVIGR